MLNQKTSAFVGLFVVVCITGLWLISARFSEEETPADIAPSVDSDDTRVSTTDLTDSNPANANAELAKAHYSIGSDGELLLPNDLEMEFEKEFRFSDGDTLRINYSIVKRFEDQLPVEIDDGTSPGFFQRLSAAALNGSQQAGLIAYRETIRCATMHTSLEEKQPGGRCDGVSGEDVLQAKQLLEGLADEGYTAAQDVYARSMMASDPVTARRHFSQLWEDGYTWGLAGLAETSPPNEELEYEQQLQEEAYVFASFAVTYAYLDGVPLPEIETHAQALADAQQDRLSLLSAESQTEVERIAKRLISENSNCCRVFTFDPKYDMN